MQNEAYLIQNSRNTPKNMSLGKEVRKLNFFHFSVTSPGHFDHGLSTQNDCTECSFSLMFFYNSMARLIQSRYVEGKYFHRKWAFQVWL